MPIVCPISLPRLSTEEFAAFDYEVMKHAFACQGELGGLADEGIYQADFAARLSAAGMESIREVPVKVSFRSFCKNYFLDLVIADTAIYELKAVRKLTEAHRMQLINYLLMLGVGHGKLVNFRGSSVDAQFVNAPLTTAERRSFQVHAQSWKGGASIRDWIIEMLRDWGTALELPLYHQAIVHLLGGDEIVTKLLPMQRNGLSLGNQRFHLMEDGHAFRVTAYGRLTKAYGSQVRRLLAHSPVKAVHWINIGHHDVTFTTIT